MLVVLRQRLIANLSLYLRRFHLYRFLLTDCP